ITEYVPNRQTKILLTDSHMFKYAAWTMSIDDVAGGVRVTCQLDAILRLRYSFLFLVLLLTYKRAFRRDLTALKHAIEQDDSAAYPPPRSTLRVGKDGKGWDEEEYAEDDFSHALVPCCSPSPTLPPRCSRGLCGAMSRGCLAAARSR